MHCLKDSNFTAPIAVITICLVIKKRSDHKTQHVENTNRAVSCHKESKGNDMSRFTQSYTVIHRTSILIRQIHPLVGMVKMKISTGSLYHFISDFRALNSKRTTTDLIDPRPRSNSGDFPASSQSGQHLLFAF